MGILYTPTAIRDRATTELSLVKNHLRIVSVDTSQDSILSLYLDAAKEMADMYCQNPFLRAGVAQAIPAGVELWLLQTVATLFALPEKNISKLMVQRDTEINYKLADLDIDYGGLKPYRLEPGFGGLVF